MRTVPHLCLNHCLLVKRSQEKNRHGIVMGSNQILSVQRVKYPSNIWYLHRRYSQLPEIHKLGESMYFCTIITINLSFEPNILFS